MTAVIFDCDGTLVDSEPLAQAAWVRSLAPHGYDASATDWAALTGLPYARVHGWFAERSPAGLPAPEVFWEAYAGELFALIDAELAPFDDALGAVRDLRARGVPVAVASSSPRQRLDRTLRHAGLADAFAVSVAGDEIEHGKPAPDMFLEAAARLGADPARCVVVEDSPPGVQAGRAAAMHVVAVVRAGADRAALAGADRVVERLDAEVILAAAG